MCILFLFVCDGSSNHSYKLILASNRDEFYKRPTLIAGPWIENSKIFGGRDLEEGREGGTWLAIGCPGDSPILKVGALLNIKMPNPNENSLGRGEIVTNFVTGHETSKSYCNQILEKNYNTFNFASVEMNLQTRNSTILCTSNVQKGITELKQGRTLGFGNSPLQTPYQKVQNGSELFEKIIRNEAILENQEMVIENLMNMLKSREKFYPDEELSSRVGKYAEDLSSINCAIPSLNYGTRTHTVILVDQNNKMDYYEETMDTQNPARGEWIKTHLEKQF